MVEDKIGYIKISRFSSDTYKEFMQKLEKLHDQGLTKLIIDVRRNPGGSLDQVVKILNQLVPERDQLLLYTEGIHTKKVEYKSTGKTFFPLEDIVVIIDEHSVSASEVLAGALQDLGRATIVGRRSFGKGLVQEMYELSDHSAINLTVAKYYLPSGRSIQKSYKDRASYDSELDKRIANGELFHEDSLKLANPESIKAPDGKMRPFGEGIVPDIFVATDSFYYTDFWKKIEKPLYQDAFQYYMKNKDKVHDALENDSSLSSLTSELSQRDTVSKLISDHENIATKILEGYLHLLKYHCYGEYTFYEKSLSGDKEVQVALQILKKHK
jgi:carboxyl-terminal processing protease